MRRWSTSSQSGLQAYGEGRPDSKATVNNAGFALIQKHPSKDSSDEEHPSTKWPSVLLTGGITLPQTLLPTSDFPLFSVSVSHFNKILYERLILTVIVLPPSKYDVRVVVPRLSESTGSKPIFPADRGLFLQSFPVVIATQLPKGIVKLPQMLGRVSANPRV